MHAFPDYGWLSEETVDSEERLCKERVWIVDPLDGTKEFINKVPEFCVAIGLSDHGQPVVGVTYNPITNEMWWSGRGMGCHLGEHRAHLTRTRMLHRASVLASRSEMKRGEWEVFRWRDEGGTDRQCRLQTRDGGGWKSRRDLHPLAEERMGYRLGRGAHHRGRRHHDRHRRPSDDF